MSTIVFTNQKGGTGKTTLAVLFALWVADRHAQSVCIIDLDSQRNASKTLKRHESGLAAAALFAAAPIAVPPTSDQRIALFAGTRGLVDLERARPEIVLPAFRQHMAVLNQIFDVCVIDTPPALGLRMSAALIATDFVACPIELEEYSVDGVTDMLKTIFGVKQKYNPCLKLLGLVPNRFNPHSMRQKEALASLIAHYEQFVIPAKISTRTSIPEALASGLPVWRLPKSAAREATAEVQQVFERLRERMSAPVVEGAVA